MAKHLSSLITVVVILVSFLWPPRFVAQELTPRAYLPLVMHNVRRPTSDQLIDAALERGEIDSETALTYKVFAAFGDARLPNVYKGDDEGLVDSHILAEVQARYASLSAATQAILNPFLIPPAYVGSWVEPLPAATGLPAQAALSVPPACGSLQLGKWTYKDGAHARVWWRKDRPFDALRMLDFIAALDGTIWPALTGLMGREPLSDALVSCNGGSGKLDIYIEPSVKRSYAASHRPPGCAHTSSYIVLNPDRSNSTLAHEFMHSIQWGYKTKVGCMYPGEYAWLAEATAEWAMDYVYPAANEEHRTADWFFRAGAAPSLELKDNKHEYGAYIFFLYLVRSMDDPGLVKRVWDNTESYDSLESLNRAIPGGFESVWAQFAAYNVNVPPFDYYKQWDDQTVHAVSFDNVRELWGAGKWTMTANVPHLGLVYQRFRFGGEHARLVTFFNGLTKQLTEGPLDDWVGMTQVDDGSKKFIFFSRPEDQIKGVKVRALFKIEGDDTWQIEDWTDKEYVSFCRDVRSERLEELVVIMSNSEYKDRSYRVSPPNQAPTIMVSDMGCWRYKGTASFETLEIGAGTTIRDYQWVDNLVFERMDAHPNIPYPFQTLQVQDGHWHRTLTFTGECNGEGSEDKTLGGVINWDKSLWTITGATSGPSIGRYLGYTTANQTVTAEVSCPDGTGDVTFQDRPFFDPSVSGPLTGAVFHVAVGGVMNETVTIPLGGSSHYKYDWTLTPQREP